jgi:hypothetical protein
MPPLWGMIFPGEAISSYIMMMKQRKYFARKDGLKKE